MEMRLSINEEVGKNEASKASSFIEVLNFEEVPNTISSTINDIRLADESLIQFPFEKAPFCGY